MGRRGSRRTWWSWDIAGSVHYSPPEGGDVHRRRSAGDLRALRKAGIPAEARLIVPGGFNVEAGRRGAAQLMNLDQPPSAIVAANDLVAIGAIDALRRMGKRVPEDVSVTGYDDIPLAGLYHPALTTMAQPVYEMGTAGMSALLARIEGPKLAGQAIRFKPKLLVRESTAPPFGTSRRELTSP
jgi:DNA-binding LacI/PurR family transcriptional regulator